MKARKGSILAVLAIILVAGVFALKVLLEPAEPKKAAETHQETMQETETAPEATQAVEYVTDENWDAMVHVYQIIMDHYDTAESLVASGQEDPSGIVEKAGEIIEYGKNCERGNLLNQEAEKVLYDMVDTADGMLTLIKAGGGEIIEISAAEETEQGGDGEGPEGGEGESGAEGQETEAEG